MIVSCLAHFSFDLMLWHTYTHLGNTHIHDGVVPSMAYLDPFFFGLSGLFYSFLPRRRFFFPGMYLSDNRMEVSNHYQIDLAMKFSVLQRIRIHIADYMKQLIDTYVVIVDARPILTVLPQSSSS